MTKYRRKLVVVEAAQWYALLEDNLQEGLSGFGGYTDTGSLLFD